jgi:uncharacterized protein with PIN domain
MVRTICDRCGREQDTTGEKYKFDFFIKILNYDLCPECNAKYLVLLKEFIQNKIEQDYQDFIDSLKDKALKKSNGGKTK